MALLGLADDVRNRMSVRRYLKLAEPPLLSARPDTPIDQSPDSPT